MVKLRQMINADEVYIKKLKDGDRYGIYTTDAHLIWFALMIPLFGNIVALAGFIVSLFKSVEIKDKEEAKEVFSTIKQGK